MPDMNASAFGGIPDSRVASGTSWQPDETPMHARHTKLKSWSLMTHYNVFVAYDRQSGTRGDDQLNSINWLMAMASTKTQTDELMLRAMFSAEPWSTTKQGYPLLFQSGEAYKGSPLVDRQHPHDLFMEVAARYRHLLRGNNTVLSLYAAPSGEPALGPTAFPHRLSAMDNPAAAISHHWLDSTHISFGVLTLGVARRQWQLEGSYFNGREPDENRWNFDRIKLDSYSARVSWNPNAQWSAQVSGGYLKSPEQLHPDEQIHRYTASVSHGNRLGESSHLAATVGWGVNHTASEDSHAIFAESTWNANSFTYFGRAEWVQKTGEELNLTLENSKWNMTQICAGVSCELSHDKPYQTALGVSLAYTFAPSELRRLYGDHPIGAWVFIRIRPAEIKMDH